ncbi:MAG: hypothetical protein M1832_006308 [Thelocarpon impressellum]|nr:MAG: hypothetical protein M1832_006308 [Thelocarpon impressellum]
MSFGFGVTDVITISRLAWQIYKTCKESSDDFKRVSTEVASLHVILKETEEFLGDKENGLSQTRKERLSMLLETAHDVLKDLERQLSSYESLGTHSQRTWDRLKWGLEDVAEVRSRLISVNTTFAAFNSSLASSSQARVERKLEKFIAEVRAGLREGSVVSSHTPQALDDSDSWAELQRELEDIGISAGMVGEHQGYIKSWFKEVMASGLLDEASDRKGTAGAHQDGSVTSSSDGAVDSTRTSSTATAAPGMDRKFSEANTLVASPTNTASSAGASQADEAAFVKPALLRARTTQDFDGLLTRHDDMPNFPAPARSDTAASHSPTALLRKHSLPSLLLYRLIQKDTRLIDAASDGSLERVAKLLSRGADVNARDRWDWTALAMAAYGGHEKIARLLLACGAEIDTVDVDGDSPYDLATNRGHAPVVIAIEEERVNRAVRGRSPPGLGRRKGSKAALRGPRLGSLPEKEADVPVLPNASLSRRGTGADPLDKGGSRIEVVGLRRATTGLG